MTTYTPPVPNDNANDAADSWHRLDPNYIAAERLGTKIFLAVLACVLLIAWISILFGLFSLTDVRGWLIGLAAFVCLALLGYLGWNMPLWNFNTTRWREVHRGFEIKRGIWWWHRIFIPRERIQHTDIIRGPIMRRFGIAKLVIYTAGTQNHEISLEGLGADQAESLRRALLPPSSSIAEQAEGSSSE